MCTGVMFEDMRHAQTQGELKAIIGDNLISDKDYAEDAYTENMCLCPVDLIKTAEKAGYIWSDKDLEGKYDPFDNWFYKGKDTLNKSKMPNGEGEV